MTAAGVPRSTKFVLELVPDASWRHQGTCSSYPDPDLWWPRTYGHVRKGTQKWCQASCHVCRAIRICKACPVVEDCLRYALAYEADTHHPGGDHSPDRCGIWGATTPRDRTRIATRRTAAAS